jgi:hypothetical protein
VFLRVWGGGGGLKIEVVRETRLPHGTESRACPLAQGDLSSCPTNIYLARLPMDVFKILLIILDLNEDICQDM